MSKSAYEIRADLLAMAKDYLDAQHAANVQLAKALQEAGGKSTDEVVSLMEMYTPDKIVEEAQKLYGQFVDPTFVPTTTDDKE